MTSTARYERLACLAEELCEAGHLIAKTVRHGFESFHPNDPTTTNRENLERELGDVLFWMRMLDDAGEINLDVVEAHAENKGQKVAQYLHYRENVEACRRLSPAKEIRSDTMEHSADALSYMVRGLLARGIPLEISNVAEASSKPSAPMDFGRLEALGVLSKEYLNGTEADYPCIRWTVLKDVKITTDRLRTYEKGDVIDWPVIAKLAQ